MLPIAMMILVLDNYYEVGHTVKRKDPAIVASATTYSGNVVRMVQVDSDEALAEYAEHCKMGGKGQTIKIIDKASLNDTKET